MELFTINRYEVNIDEIREGKSEGELLKNLLKKVEKRKKKKRTKELQAVEETEKDPLDSEISSKLQKREHFSDHQDTVLAESEINTQNAESSNDDPKGSRVPGDFEVLGEDDATRAKMQKVDIVLPPWLAHPTIIPSKINNDSKEENLDVSYKYLAPHVRHSLKELHVARLFPVQSAVIPWLLEAHNKPPPFRPRDICVSAPTGSGKTLAFAVPVVQLLANRVQRKIRALVVLPVVELAVQVYKVFKKLCEKTDLTAALLSTQVPFTDEQENLVEYYDGVYYSKVDIIVTTPGRLVDHLHSTKNFDLSALKFLIIDEADRIMDAVFQNWLYHLDAHVRATSNQLLSGRVPPLCFNEVLIGAATQPHKLLFSATLSHDPEKLQNMGLFQPKLFTSIVPNAETLSEALLAAAAIARQTTSTSDADRKELRGDFVGKYSIPAELSEKYCLTEARLKPLTLYSLIKENKWIKFLCFTNSAESSYRLAFVLGKLFDKEFNITCLSASMNNQSRAKALQNFIRGKTNGLICTDALARGIDAEVDIVISYDVPRHIKTYIHRIGRTARAGRPGTAVMLLTQPEFKIFNHTLGQAGKQLTEEITVASSIEENYAVKYSEILKQLRQYVEKEQNQKAILKAKAKQRVAKAMASSSHKSAGGASAAMTLTERFHMQVEDLFSEKYETSK